MTTTNHTPLTSTTFADFPQGLPVDNRKVQWEEAVDLGHELQALAPHLTIESCRALIYAVTSGMPVTLQWDTRLNTGQVERTTTTVMVDQLIEPRGVRYDELRVRHCGFGHPLMLRAVRYAETPETHREFLDA